MKILLVEDERSMLFTLTNLLKQRGHEVIAATSAEKGLNDLGEQQVDLVISDLRLPGMDGIGLIKKVKEKCEDAVPIIISAYGSFDNAIDALKLNVCDFLRKPFDLVRFEEAIAKAERRRSELITSKSYLSQLQENLIDEERKRTILSRFVSRPVVESILSEAREPAPSGKTQKVSVLFVDISGFTGLAETLDQESLVMLLNTFYSTVEPVVRQNGGLLDKFMGDGIMAVFSGSTDGQKSSVQAVSAAIQIQLQADKLQSQMQRFSLPPVTLHLGVSTGRAAACSIGSEEFANYTYIGDAVNLAKQLQELARPGQIVASAATVKELSEELQNVPGLQGLHQLPPLEIKGRREEVAAYEVSYDGKAGSAGVCSTPRSQRGS
ncbi:MAG: response regulator [Deltaproteobacteria bacterium]|nr:response regulator [Deltaproteobacteria bacterium]MBW2071594.1 response regulator [Deltaproteobacteria bacterium]